MRVRVRMGLLEAMWRYMRCRNNNHSESEWFGCEEVKDMNGSIAFCRTGLGHQLLEKEMATATGADEKTSGAVEKSPGVKVPHNYWRGYPRDAGAVRRSVMLIFD